MAKKIKTLQDLDLRELLSELTQSVTYFYMLTDPSSINGVLSNEEFKEKFLKCRDHMKTQISEMCKRFNAPANYD